MSEDNPCSFVFVTDLNVQLVTNVSLVIVLLGIPANLLAFGILRHSITGKTMRFLLMVLSLEDALLLLLYGIYYVANHYSDFYGFSSLSIIRYADSPLLFLLNWTKMTEVYTIVIVSIDRYICIKFPFHSNRLCTVGNVRKALLVVIVVAFFIKLPNLIVGYKQAVLNNCSVYSTVEVFSNLPWFVPFNIIYINLLDQVVSFIIPLVIILALNVCLIRHVRSVNSGRRALSHLVTNVVLTASSDQSHATQRNLTITLVAVITVFIMCETPTSMVFLINVYNIITDRMDEGDIMSNLYPFALVFMLLNCSINFVIYLLVGKNFRRKLVNVMCGSCCHLEDRPQTSHSTRLNFEVRPSFSRDLI